VKFDDCWVKFNDFWVKCEGWLGENPLGVGEVGLGSPPPLSTHRWSAYFMKNLKVFFANKRMGLSQTFMPRAIVDATWKTLTTAFTEQVEEFKANRCEACTMAQSSIKRDVCKAVKRYLRQDSGEDHITEHEIEMSVSASFMFPTSGRVARTRDVHGTKEWLRLLAGPGE